MGNGRITNIYDVVLVDIENFDRTKTNAMAAEVDQINKKLAEEKREYVLMAQDAGAPVTHPPESRFIGRKYLMLKLL